MCRAEGIEGIVCYEGPGSFTGLRIGLSFGNALAYTRGIPIVGARDSSWIEKGLIGFCMAPTRISFYRFTVLKHISRSQKSRPVPRRRIDTCPLVRQHDWKLSIAHTSLQSAQVSALALFRENSEYYRSLCISRGEYRSVSLHP